MEWSPEDSLVSFSKVERTAIGLILLIILLGATSGYWMPSIWPHEEESVDAGVAFQAEIDAWEIRNQYLVDSLSRIKAERDKRYAENRAKWNKPRSNSFPSKRKWPKYKSETVAIDYSIPLPELGSVDANSVELDQLLRIGISPKIARNWVKFRERGGSFVRKEDIGKLYGMSDTTLTRVLPYLKSPDLKARKERVFKEPVMVNVNLASSEELQQVRGIGAYYADRIVEYRQQLGGFLTLSQVEETPGLREGAFVELREKLTMTREDPRFILINELSDWQLAKHPYITKKQAEIIVLNRRNHGRFVSREDLLETIVLDTATVDRIMPYIDFGE
ncbi:MAG: helix-hairpin-helix domain-containing protein [Saprospiraceae bacterium]